jgi:hypothetical protein
LENAQTLKLVNESFHRHTSDLNTSIAYEVNEAFSPVYGNIDTFLNFHYSVLGEYTELVAVVSNEIDSTIKEKLFGEGFTQNMEILKEEVSQKYIKTLKIHLEDIDTLATTDINKTLNAQIFATLNEDIEARTSLQVMKLASIIGTITVVKIIAIVTAKIIAKTASKLALKSAIKSTAKITASTTAGTAGLGCGPLAWICSPVAATVAWFGTDALIISADEYMNRDVFKQDLIAMLDIEKKALTEKLQNAYTQQFEEDSLFIQKSFKNTIVKKQVKKTIRLKEKIFK